MEKQKKMIILLAVLAIMGGMILTYITTNLMMSAYNNDTAGEYKADAGIDEIKEKLEKDNDILVMESTNQESDQNDEERLYGIYEQPEKLKNKELISESEAKNYERKARLYFRSNQFEEGLGYLTEAVEKYSNEGYGKVIHDLYNDVSMILNLYHFYDEKMSFEGQVSSMYGIKQIMSGIRDPEMALIGLLNLDLTERNEILISWDSLNPLFEGKVDYLSREEINNDISKEIIYMYPNTEKIYQFDIRIEGNDLYAIVMRDKDGYSSVFGIFEKEEGSTYYNTKSEWINIFNVVEENNKRLKETKGKINDELQK